jgi:hypothetical protein
MKDGGVGSFKTTIPDYPGFTFCFVYALKTSKL